MKGIKPFILVHLLEHIVSGRALLAIVNSGSSYNFCHSNRKFVAVIVLVSLANFLEKVVERCELLVTSSSFEIESIAIAKQVHQTELLTISRFQSVVGVPIYGICAYNLGNVSRVKELENITFGNCY